MNPTTQDGQMPRKKAELQTVPPEGDMTISMQSAQQLLTLAVQKGADVTTLERLMDLRDRVMREEAKIAFNKAMAAFQAECPVISKTKEVHTNDGKLAYKYAPIESAVAQVKELVQKHGFRYSTTMKFNQNKEGEKTVIAYCRVVHELGHEEVSEMEVPMGNKTQIMSQSQVVAAASTFAKRYAFLNAFGIMTGDDDNDTADQRGDAPGRAPRKKQQDQEQTPAPPKKQRPPRGTPYYDPEEDDGTAMTPKQRAFLTKRWGEYMDKSGITENGARAAAMEKFVPWAFEKFKKPAAVDTLTIAQASYLIDYIPTMPVKGKEPPAPPAAPATPGNTPPAAPGGASGTGQPNPGGAGNPNPAVKPLPQMPAAPVKPKTLSDDDISARVESIEAQPDLLSLEIAWKDILEEKKSGVLGGTFYRLHQAYIRTKASLK